MVKAAKSFRWALCQPNQSNGSDAVLFSSAIRARQLISDFGFQILDFGFRILDFQIFCIVILLFSLSALKCEGVNPVTFLNWVDKWATLL